MNKLNTSNFYGYCALLLGPIILILPFILKFNLLYYDYQRIIINIYYAVWLFYFARVVYMQQQWERSMLIFIMSVFFICLLQIFRSEEIKNFMPEVIILLGCSTLIIAFANSQNLWSTIKYSLLIFVALQMALSLIIILLSFLTGKVYDLHKVAMGHSNYRMLNHIQTIWIPLLMAIWLSTYKKKNLATSLVFILLILNLAFIFHSGARATTVGLAIAGISAAIFLGKLGRRWFIYLLIATLAGFALKTVLFAGIPNGADRIQQTLESKGVDTERKKLWRRAWVGIQQAPWFGNGPQSYASAKLLYRDIALEPSLKGVQNSGAHPHNVYLQIAYEWGIPVLILLLNAASWVMIHLIKIIKTIKDEKQKIIAISLFSGVVAVSVDAIFSGNFTVPLSQIWIAILLGLTWNWMRQFGIRESKTVSFSSVTQRSFAAFLIAAIGFSQIFILFPEVIDINAYRQYVVDNIMPPAADGSFVIRFWSHGWF